MAQRHLISILVKDGLVHRCRILGAGSKSHSSQLLKEDFGNFTSNGMNLNNLENYLDNASKLKIGICSCLQVRFNKTDRTVKCFAWSET